MNWTTTEEASLRALYRNASWKDLGLAIPGRTRTAIASRARRLKVSRINRAGHGFLPQAIVIIIDVACLRSVPIPDLMGFTRDRRVTHARWEAMSRMRKELGLSLPQIGDIFGRDHTTVLHALRRFDAGYKPWDSEPRREAYRKDGIVVRVGRICDPDIRDRSAAA